ncbi:MAG: beta-ketoacyl-ACP synthase II [Bryobacterales bacterium]|nr:beta-ketoacyl-ACP synthase II [Bryobacterales bacterium]
MVRRVVVTGVGLVSALGIGTQKTWNGVKSGRSGIRRIQQFDTTGFSARIAGEVPDFDPLLWIEKKESRKMGRFIHFGIVASQFAMEQSGLQVTDDIAEEVGVYIGSGIGGFEVIEREHKILLEKGPSRISPFFIPASIVNLASGHVSIKYGAKGPNSATATACATSAHSIGDSFRLVQRGEALAMICGGAEATITPLGVGGFAAMRALSTRNDEPERASRPWDHDRDGFVVGEGAGILVIEEMEFAKKRGANILAEIVGYGMTSDAYHITAGSETGEGIIRVMRKALKDAGIGPEQIDYINAHATSTPVGDQLEALALRSCFGDHAMKMAISSTKSMTGHLLGGAGGLEAGVTVLGIGEQVAPPTINLETIDPDCSGLNFVVGAARDLKINYALSNSFGFGGTNGCLIFKRFDG